MPESESGKELIQQIRKILKGRVDRVIGHSVKPELHPEEYLPEIDDLPELIFARNLVKVNGKFAYCSDKKELLTELSKLFQDQAWESVFSVEESISQFLDMAGIPFTADMDRIKEIEVVVTGCEFLIARTGSVLVSSQQIHGRRLFGYAPVHVVIAFSSQLKNELGEGLAGLREKYSSLPSLISTITGPSRTADIEKTLVHGMHGPEELYVFLVNDN